MQHQCPEPAFVQLQQYGAAFRTRSTARDAADRVFLTVAWRNRPGMCVRNCGRLPRWHVWPGALPKDLHELPRRHVFRQRRGQLHELSCGHVLNWWSELLPDLRLWHLLYRRRDCLHRYARLMLVSFPHAGACILRTYAVSHMCAWSTACSSCSAGNRCTSGLCQGTRKVFADCRTGTYGMLTKPKLPNQSHSLR